MNRQEFIRLLDKYLDGDASEEEQALLLAYYQKQQTTEDWDEETLGNSAQTGQHIWHQLTTDINVAAPSISLYRRRWLQVAAAVLALVCTGAFFWYGTNTQAPHAASQAGPKAVPAPLHKQGAVLTLSDGTVIVLDNAADGVLARQGNTVVKKQGRKIMYEPALQKEPGRDITEGYNRIVTAKGAQYQVVLPDGSSAWLNAASAMRFSAGNAQAVRRIEVEGEVYFEVTKNRHRPFKVAVLAPLVQYNNAVIEVLGTHFNINAYADEKVLRTTLLEGSLIMHTSEKDPAGRLLAPGQQAQMRSAAAIKIKPVNVSQVMAWQKGLFDFEEAPTAEVMRQLARWYDIEVVFKNKGQSKSFSGRLSRHMTLADILKILEQSGIRLAVQGRIITVLS